MHWRLCLAVLSFFVIHTHGSQVTIVTISIGQNQLYGYYNTGPVLDVAFDLVSRKYPNIFQNITRQVFYRKVEGSSSCTETGDIMYDVAAEVFRFQQKSKGFFIILSPGCSLEMIALGDYAREMNIPLFSSTAADRMLANRVRYPTVTLFSSGGQGVTSNAVLKFMNLNGWRTITVLCDTLSHAPSIATIYLTTCRAYRMLLTEDRNRYQMYSEQFDSSYSTDYEGMLRRAKEQSRVIAIGANGDIMRKIMVLAHSLNMTNKDYVFLYTIPLQVPQHKMPEWKQNDSSDAIALEAFASIIAFELPPPDWEILKPFTQAVVETARTKYNYTISADERENDVALCSLEAVEVLAQILNETWPTVESLNGIRFTTLTQNRSFNLGFRTVDIGYNGFRTRDTVISVFNVEAGRFQATWYHHWSNNSIMETSKFTGWFGENPLPPNAPLCGFRGDLCHVNTSGTVVGPAVGCAIGFLLLLSILLIIMRHRIIEPETDATRWFLDDNDVIQQKDVNKPMESLTARDEHLVSAKTAHYKGHPVWIESIVCTVTQQQLFYSKQAHDLFHTLKSFRQLNISIFYGVSVLGNLANVVYESHERGTLHCLLGTDNHFDISLQRSIIWEIIDGVNQIHLSYLGYHGNLSPFCIFLDKRFTIKICGYATRALSCVVTGKYNFKFEEANKVFVGPEYLTNESAAPTKAGDIYSVTVISLKVIERISANDQVDPRWIEIIKMLELGQARVPSERPSTKQLMTSLQRLMPRENMLDSILRTLEKHAENLEGLIAERTHDLLEEQNKSDELLKTMIPPKFVNALRNKQLIPAEQFECVTVMFSDLPHFGAFGTSSTSLEVTALLNTIYMTLDAAVVLFDVYKVETINDSYMVASGLPERNGDQHAGQIALLSLKFIEAFNSLQITRLVDSSLKLRIGFHSGPCAAGLVGLKMPRYCLFGDTINTASRMESHGEVSRIHLSCESKNLLDRLGGFIVEFRGEMAIKGKGMKRTFWLVRSANST